MNKDAAEFQRLRRSLALDLSHVGALLDCHPKVAGNMEAGTYPATPAQLRLLRALAASPAASAVRPTLIAVGPVAAICAGLDYLIPA